MQVQKENNKWMVETIAQFSSSTATTYLPQPMLTHNGENVVNVVNNKNENGRNGNNKIDPLLNTTNPSIVGILITVTPSTNVQRFFTKEELENVAQLKEQES